jgi:glycosyltransferase involved in cell wall biosynthesis
MGMQEEPLVSVLTPVYNGEEFLVDCIESVLRQTYTHYEYIIINNRSTDRTLEIARNYAAKDLRIRVHNNADFVDVIANHNIAFSLISPDAKYCKVVSADDFLFSDCIRRMVECAEANPSVGIVGSYQLSGDQVRWQGFEYPKAVFSGLEVCRRIFIGRDSAFGFGSPTSILYRADLVRSSPAFYPNPSPHSDTSACLRDLQNSDFGFVYEVLSYERTHQATQSSASADINRYSSAYLNDLLQYGAAFLSPEERRRLLTGVLRGYHRFLAIAYLTESRGDDFWDYHEARLKELGCPLRRVDLLAAIFRELMQALMNPGLAFNKIRKRLLPRPANSVANAYSPTAVVEHLAGR